MEKEQFADLLNGRSYRDEMSSDEEVLAKQHGLLICFGASDDLLEFRGIIYDEVVAYNGGSAMLIKKKGGKIDVISEEDVQEVQEIMDDKELDFKLSKVEVTAEWCPDDLECSWRITTTLPHATFDIMEDGELYCRGIVIEKSDIEKALSI